jgi:beta-galactosidase
MPEFVIGERDFELDGRPVRVLSGALHYFRVHPDLWADRIDKARRMGLNTIETYVPWNAHAPTPGAFDLTGGLDLGRFLRAVGDAGMHAIVRPGPYICSEWDGGGLPAWLFRDPGVGVRRCEPRYLAAVGDFLERVYEVLAPLQVDRGGPVVLVQVENEYGAFGEDREYLAALVALTRKAGITVPLVTVDQPIDRMLAAGGVEGAHRTGSFGSRIARNLAALRAHQPSGPLMCMEFWDGWFDHWGEYHHTTDAEVAAADLAELLAAGASVNLYMFHGGTNPGLTNGANHNGVYQPIVTSYDYDAPLDEAGSPTAKYHAFREVLTRYNPVADDPPAPAAPAPTATAALTGPVRLLDQPRLWGEWRPHATMPLLDDIDPVPKYALMRTTVDSPGVFSVTEVRDRVQVFLDGAPVGVLQRDHGERALTLTTAGELVLLVEDQGRVNYGPHIGEPKGLLDPLLDGVALTGWDVLPLELSTPPRAQRCSPAGAGPVLRTALVELAEPADLFLDTAGWGKGVVWVNGACVGRYWARGPQRTLYVPGPLTVAGENHFAVLETETVIDAVVRLVAGPLLGATGT